MSTSSTLDCSLPIVASALFLDNFFVAADIGEVFPRFFSASHPVSIFSKYISCCKFVYET